MTWKERLKKYAPYAAYPAFYLVMFVFFSFLTFPYEAVRDRIVATFNAEQAKAPSPQELQIDELSSALPLGVKMKGVRLISPPTEPGGQPATLTLDEARVRPHLLPLLIGKQSFSFAVKGLGGEAEGDLGMSSKEKELEVELDGIDVGQVPALVQAIGLPLDGKASGKIKLDMPEGKAAKANGAVNLEITEFAVGDGKAKIKNMLALPRVNVGTLSITAEAKDGALKVTKLGAGGRDVELQGDGRIALRDLALESTADLFLRFKVNDAYRGKSDLTKSIFGAPGSTQPSVLELADPKVKKAKREDGFYAWHVKGPLARIDFEPAPQYAGPGTAK